MKNNKTVTRKEFLTSSAKQIFGFFAGIFSETLDDIENTFPDRIRPPGAIPEDEFLSKCTHCGKCVKACQYSAIKLLDQIGSLDFGTPVINIGGNYCRFCSDQPCSVACDSSALVFQPDKIEKIGTAVISGESCLRMQQISCIACSVACPGKFNAIRFSQPTLPPVISVEKCSGCGACVAVCNASPVAIKIIKKN
ncbi:MAG: 4Fe-4S binding protein [Candidatus Riflebacteria bacterium]|nr:4Fe-4S binding protein [Candidatus Riflebacteria bacterium]